jgi:hypothetical protein
MTSVFASNALDYFDDAFQRAFEKGFEKWRE